MMGRRGTSLRREASAFARLPSSRGYAVTSRRDKPARHAAALPGRQPPGTAALQEGRRYPWEVGDETAAGLV